MSKWVVVTGAAGGIGRECAKRFARDGFNVHLIDLPGVPLEDVVAAAQDAGGHKPAPKCWRPAAIWDRWRNANARLSRFPDRFTGWYISPD